MENGILWYITQQNHLKECKLEFMHEEVGGVPSPLV